MPPLVFLEIADEKSRHSLHENMSKIKAPTQVIWGKQDQVHSPLRLPHGTVPPSLPMSTRGGMARAVLPSCALLCSKLTHVSPSLVGLDTGVQRGGKLPASTGPREGRAKGWGGQVPAPQQAWAGKRNKVPANRVVLATGEKRAVHG